VIIMFFMYCKRLFIPRIFIMEEFIFMTLESHKYEFFHDNNVISFVRQNADPRFQVYSIHDKVMYHRYVVESKHF